MSCKEFLEKLDALLQDIPEEERAEALRFYSEYFSDAGPFQEEAILAELVSPEHVASMIKQSLPGYEDTARQPGSSESEPQADQQTAPEIPLPIYARQGARSGGFGENQQQNYQQQSYPQPCRPAGDKRSNLILIVLLAVLLLPLWGSLLISVLAILFSVVVCGAAFLIGGTVSVIACLIVLIFNIPNIVAAGLGTGMMAVGVLLLSMAASLLLLAAGWFILFWLIPAIFRVTKRYVINPLRGKGVC